MRGIWGEWGLALCVGPLAVSCATAPAATVQKDGEPSPPLVEPRQPPLPAGDETPVAPPPVCPDEASNLLANPGFDHGAGSDWLQSPGGTLPLVFAAEDLPVSPQDGGYAAWLGGYSAPVGVDRLLQAVTVPAEADQLQLVGFLYIATEEQSGEGAGEFDTLTVSLRSENGTLLEVLKDPSVPSCASGDCTWSNEDETGGWMPFSLNTAGAHGGRALQVQLEAVVDFSLNTNFFIDSLALRVASCKSPP